MITLGKIPEQRSYRPGFSLGNKKLQQPESKKYDLLFHSISDFLVFVEKAANERLQTGNLKEISLCKHPQNGDYFNYIRQFDKSTIILFESLKALIEPLFGHRIYY